MKKEKIVNYLKELQKETCKSCPVIEYKFCSSCKIHILVNKIMNELNGD